MNGMPGVNSTADVNVHTLALQVPVDQLTRSTPRARATPLPSSACGPPPAANGSGSGADWLNGGDFGSGPWTPGVATGQPAGQRAPHRHRRQGPCGTRSRRRPTAGSSSSTSPRRSCRSCCRACTRASSPTWRPTTAARRNVRPDIEAIFLTGIPAGVITPAPTFTNYNGTGVKADMLRLNTAIPPSSSPNNLGLLGLDVAGWPNGRRVFDDVATIALRPWPGRRWASSYRRSPPTPRPGWSTSGSRPGAPTSRPRARENYLDTFPYLGTPYSGYSNPAVTPVSVAP